MEYFQLLIGFVLLIGGADFLVKGGVQIAMRFGLPSLLIGLTIVAFGTSAPELLVSLTAALKGNSGIAIGNVIGSNIANIGLILGISALVLPIRAQGEGIVRDITVTFLLSLAFFAAFSDGCINRLEGGIGVCFLVLYFVYLFYRGRGDNRFSNSTEVADDKPRGKLWVAFCFVVGACFALAIGAQLLVESASSIARALGVSDRVIGVTVVAFGTSLPELATSLVAALRKEADISIGNVIGSNLFNIAGVIGLSSLISPIYGDFEVFKGDLVWMSVFCFLLLPLIFPLRRNLRAIKEGKIANAKVFFCFEHGVLGRFSGAFLLLLYVIYIFFLF